MASHVVVNFWTVESPELLQSTVVCDCAVPASMCARLGVLVDRVDSCCVHVLQVPEVAFTGDTSGELFEKDGNADLYRAKLLIVECTFVDDSVTWEQVGTPRTAAGDRQHDTAALLAAGCTVIHCFCMLQPLDALPAWSHSRAVRHVRLKHCCLVSCLPGA